MHVTRRKRRRPGIGKNNSNYRTTKTTNPTMQPPNSQRNSLCTCHLTHHTAAGTPAAPRPSYRSGHMCDTPIGGLSCQGRST